MYDRRNPTSRSIQEPRTCSPSPAYPDSAACRRSSSRRNPVMAAARSVAGVFGACVYAPVVLDSKKRVQFPASKLSAASSGPRAGTPRNRSTDGGIFASPCQQPGTVEFTLEMIFKATRNFSPSFKIGQGGFGVVYKVQLDDGTWVAIKRARKSVSDKHVGMEFRREVLALAQVDHLNLVKFYGCLENDGERILVMEYVQNGTLREHLDCKHGNALDLATRLDIAIDIAHALTYLHMYTDHHMIHRDIKSSNILLTENFRAKVADFGFARPAADFDSSVTHVSTMIKGTAGYLDPEYLRTFQLTDKSDVYSFGVLLVEIVTGLRPIEVKAAPNRARLTTKWALKKFTDGDLASVMDSKLKATVPDNMAVQKILNLALQCLGPNRHGRPNMKSCAVILRRIRKDYR